ncbi:hypothetical protein KIPB_002852 [Kipferlia bialata]|uniref:Uncharacterized protein n=1 Tax=Kipferlia bialata TaxID=797122 RepID=A0A391NJM0_9EUKA|nr:hypothetical protein KIPB_002852 [Kipferlia bialata]|eukprot:g2852.t1
MGDGAPYVVEEPARFLENDYTTESVATMHTNANYGNKVTLVVPGHDGEWTLTATERMFVKVTGDKGILQNMLLGCLGRGQSGTIRVTRKGDRIELKGHKNPNTREIHCVRGREARVQFDVHVDDHRGKTLTLAPVETV